MNEARMEMALGNVDQQKIKIEEEAEKLRANELVKQFKAEMGILPPEPRRDAAAEDHRRARGAKERLRQIMAVKIEKGGWVLIFLVGLGLVGYSLQKYGAVNFRSRAGLALRPISQRARWIPRSRSPSRRQARPSWTGARARQYLGGLRGRPGGQRRPRYRLRLHLRQAGLKVTFKIIDDWTEGAAALATNNVDMMLTTADVWAKDFGQFQDKGVSAHAFYMVDWSRGADGVIGKQGINSIEDLAGKTVAFAPYTPSHFLLWNGLKASGLSTEQRNEIFNKAVHTKDGIEPATLFAQQKVDAAVAWDPDMSDAVTKRPGAKKIYDTRVANHLIADVLVVSDRFAASSPATVVKFIAGLAEGRRFHQERNPSRAYTLIGTIKDFNIPADLAKTMLGGVKLADYADNQQFFGTRRLRFRLRQHLQNGPGDVPRTAAHQAHLRPRGERRPPLHRPARRQVPGAPPPSRPSTYKEPPKGATPIATATSLHLLRHQFGQNGPRFARRGRRDRRLHAAYENTVVDIDGNTDATGSRALNMELSKQRADAVKSTSWRSIDFPPTRMRTAGNGPDKPAGRQRHAGGPREEPAHRYQGVSESRRVGCEAGSRLDLSNLLPISSATTPRAARG